MAHANFGKDKSGKPYTVELGANWASGLGGEGAPENPVWTFVRHLLLLQYRELYAPYH
jgi:polyamine oxidase